MPSHYSVFVCLALVQELEPVFLLISSIQCKKKKKIQFQEHYAFMAFNFFLIEPVFEQRQKLLGADSVFRQGHDLKFHSNLTCYRLLNWR